MTLISILYVSIGVLLLIKSSEVTDTVRDALSFTAVAIIPALFPYMIIAKLITASGVLTAIPKKLTRMANRLFALEREGFSAVLLGFLSGFPIGAISASDSYSKGKLSKAHAERALALAHNTGPSFPVAFVGGMLWGSKFFGLFLYGSQILSWIVIATLSSSARHLPAGKSLVVNDVCKTSSRVNFTECVVDSAYACIAVGGFTVFTRVTAKLALILVPNITFSASALLSCILEFSEGCVKASAIGGITGVALTGFAIGFGGISALLQSAAPALKNGLSVKSLIIFKVSQGVLCALLSAVYFIICPIKPFSTISASLPLFYRKINIITAIITLLIITATIKKSTKQSKRN